MTVDIKLNVIFHTKLDLITPVINSPLDLGLSFKEMKSIRQHGTGLFFMVLR